MRYTGHVLPRGDLGTDPGHVGKIRSLGWLGSPSVFPKTGKTFLNLVEVVHLCLNCSPCDLDPYKVDAWMDIE